MENFIDNEGYPTDEYLQFIKDYKPEVLPIMDMVSIICENWYFGSWGWKIGRRYKGIIKFQLHTGGWSGNEEIIQAIVNNIYFTHFKMNYVGWKAGGHYYFEIKID